ncbi:hypothetical protein EVAR_4399_1 [Eumeta japonica]|uniref:Uncharacterized protein n=1 Tax=Eumeta variegata TaxID=151549 RepID=A0A4C1T0D4_EUMVA|nr:hypothetical protein EVAR_4399_1 [Eumeta japonica]
MNMYKATRPRSGVGTPSSVNLPPLFIKSEVVAERSIFKRSIRSGFKCTRAYFRTGDSVQFQLPCPRSARASTGARIKTGRTSSATARRSWSALDGVFPARVDVSASSFRPRAAARHKNILPDRSSKTGFVAAFRLRRIKLTSALAARVDTSRCGLDAQTLRSRNGSSGWLDDGRDFARVSRKSAV